MGKKVSTNVSIDADIKAQAQELCEKLGLDLSTAMNMFLHQFVMKRAIPFAIEAEEPNAVTIAAIEAADNGEDMYGPFDTIEELMVSLNA